MEDKIISVATENKKEAESKAEPQESQSVSQADKKMVDTVAVPQNMQAVANGIPVYYQIPLLLLFLTLRSIGSLCTTFPVPSTTGI